MSKDTCSAYKRQYPSQFLAQNQAKIDQNHAQSKNENESATGFLKIPHKELEQILRVGKTKAELLVLFCLYRFTRGFNRQSCRASQSFIARWAGIDKSSVQRALSSLIAEGIVSRLNSHQGSASSSIRTSTSVLSLNLSEKLLASCHQEAIGKMQPVANITDGRMHADGPKTGGILHHKKETLLKKKDSSSFYLKKINVHLDSYQRSWEKKIEVRALKVLEEKKHAEDKIYSALCYVKKHGTLGKEQKKCKYPLCYLEKSIEKVLEVSKTNETNLPDTALQNKAISSSSHENKFAEAHKHSFDQKFEVAKKLFQKHFVDVSSQEQAIDEALKKKFKSFQPGGQRRVTFGIMAWVEQTCGKDFFQGISTRGKITNVCVKNQEPESLADCEKKKAWSMQ